MFLQFVSTRFPYLSWFTEGYSVKNIVYIDFGYIDLGMHMEFDKQKMCSWIDVTNKLVFSLMKTNIEWDLNGFSKYVLQTEFRHGNLISIYGDFCSEKTCLLCIRNWPIDLDSNKTCWTKSTRRSKRQKRHHSWKDPQQRVGDLTSDWWTFGTQSWCRIRRVHFGSMTVNGLFCE